MANQIIVSEDRNQITVVEGETRIVEVVTQGPQGPVGPSGPQGPSGSSILNQITSGSVTGSVNVGSTIFSLTSGSSTYLAVSSSGNVGIGTTTPTSRLYILDTGSEGRIVLEHNRPSGGIYFFRNAGTAQNPIAVGNTFELSAGGWDGTQFTYNRRTSIRVAAAGAWNSGSNGGWIIFQTVASGSIVPFIQAIITDTGNFVSAVDANLATARGRFHVRGNTTFAVSNSVYIENSSQTNLFTIADNGNTSINGNTTITGSLTVTGNITAQTLVVQTITSSVSFITGSTKFGSLSTNTHEFTGSIFVSGSTTITSGLSAGNISAGSLAAGATSIVGLLQTPAGIFCDNNLARFRHVTVGVNQASGTGFIQPEDASQSIGIRTGVSFGGTQRLLVTNTGLVAIGSHTPIATLDVSGSTRLIGGLVVTGSTTITSGLSVGSDTTINGITRINNASLYALRLLNSTVIAGHDGAGGSELSLNLSTAYLSGYGALQLRTLQTGNLTLATNNTNRVWVSGVSGNVSVGSSNDSGDRLQVYGATFLSGSVTGSDMLIRGSGNTSTTTALTVQNSDSTNMFRVRNDGNTFTNFGSYIGSSNQNVILATDATGANSASGLNLKILFGSFSTAGYGVYIQGFNTGTRTATSGESGVLLLGHGFAPTSGNGTFNGLVWQGTINQTGGANGITRGLYVNPTLTAAADFRAIEWSNNAATAPSASWGLYGAGTAPNYLAGALSIGVIGGSQGLRIGRAPTSADAASALVNVAIPSTSTSIYRAFASSIGLNTSGFTLPNLSHFEAIQDGAFTAGVVTNQYGFRVNALLDGTNLYAFHSNIGAATGRWNLYMAGTADNFLAGNLGIGVTPTVRLHVSGSTVLRGDGNTSGTNALNIQNSDAVSAFTVRNDGLVTINSVTVARYNVGGTVMSISTPGHNGSTGITITTGNPIQAFSNVGVSVSNPTGASIYAAGGGLVANISLGLISNRALITSTANGLNMHTSSMLQVDSTSQGFLPPRMTTTQKNAITTPATGLVVYDTTLNKLCVYTTTWETITSA